MATLMPSEQTTHGGGGAGKQSIVDDFMYGSNVAGSHIYKADYDGLTNQVSFSEYIVFKYVVHHVVKALHKGKGNFIYFSN